MNDEILFETPENIELSYKPAGLGTRFLAWFVDMIILTGGGIFLFFLLACSGVLTDSVLNDAFGGLKDEVDEINEHQVVFIMLGIWLLLWGLGSFVYFGCSELLMRGQTIGKRMLQIRVVAGSGFSLDAAGVLVRNVFRVIDHLPVLWVVPLLSAQSKRFGDMVGGTLVIQDEHYQSIEIREVLAAAKPVEATFRFDSTMLQKLRPQDLEAIEKLLERWNQIPEQLRHQLIQQIIPPLVKRMNVEAPPASQEREFLTDLLAAEYRRQNRKLG